MSPSFEYTFLYFFFTVNKKVQFQALVVLIMCCLGHSHEELVKDEITNWSKGLNLIYAKSYLESLQAGNGSIANNISVIKISLTT